MLQPHQAAVVAVNNEDVQCPRRERRGRPRLEDYVYVCDEVCGHCGGEWKLDGDEDAEEETRLIRCKDCRGAFHLDCMMLHGKSEGGYEIIDDDASGSCKENKPALNSLQDDKEGQDVPKRCFQCECNKSKFARRRALAPTLEAIIGTKILTVRITPELPLEAKVHGTNVTCYVTLQK
mmetsp:Transcript_18660/g.27649  ORF Transcript_18660/g.27649 Transcript_18660/m.27649 type:complete len:178 (+) Transcript_18660:171-704(+)